MMQIKTVFLFPAIPLVVYTFSIWMWYSLSTKMQARVRWVIRWLKSHIKPQLQQCIIMALLAWCWVEIPSVTSTIITVNIITYTMHFYNNFYILENKLKIYIYLVFIDLSCISLARQLPSGYISGQYHKPRLWSRHKDGFSHSIRRSKRFWFFIGNWMEAG